MALDISTITGVPQAGAAPILAARLCNFDTGQDYPLGTHVACINQSIPVAIKDLQNPWVDLIGYASNLGNAESNRQLSWRRCENVKKYVALFSNRLNFQIEWAKGSTESSEFGGGARDNDGYYRAVGLYIYGAQPPKLVTPPAQASNVKHFRMRVVAGGSVAFPLIKGIQHDSYVFQIVDVAEHKSALFLFSGLGLALPTIIPSPPVSGTLAGPYSDFKIIGNEDLWSFAGAAELWQDPGATGGSLSVGGTMRLSLNSSTITKHGSLVIPRSVVMSSGSGVSISAGSVTSGKLSMTGSPTAYPE